jgi:hypothetical protein
MYVKIKPGMLAQLPFHHQNHLSEGRRYFAEDCGTNIVIPVGIYEFPIPKTMRHTYKAKFDSYK